MLHERVADDRHIIAGVRINECSRIGQITQWLLIEALLFVGVDDVHRVKILVDLRCIGRQQTIECEGAIDLLFPCRGKGCGVGLPTL